MVWGMGQPLHGKVVHQAEAKVFEQGEALLATASHEARLSQVEPSRTSWDLGLPDLAARWSWYSARRA